MQKILEAIAAIRAEVEHVGKPDVNKGIGYSYAGEAAIANAVRPGLNKHGIVIIQSAGTQCEVADGITTIRFGFTVYHVSGESMPEAFVFGQGKDLSQKAGVGDKGATMANTQAFKYFLNRLFMLNTGDDPDDDEPIVDPPKRKRQTQARGKSAKPANEADLQTLGTLCVDKAASLFANVDGCSAAWEQPELVGAIRNHARKVCGIAADAVVDSSQIKAIADAIRGVELSVDTFEILP